MTSFLLGFILGLFSFLGYFIWRMLRSDGWDDSNANNAIRLLSHLALHPEDFGQMYYLPYSAKKLLMRFGYKPDVDFRRPFWYVSKDEFSEVVNSRPEEKGSEEGPTD